ncbi:MAG: right-handed parallel beta-helix repeat-containing protein, partial [Clostridia bacterium]|nr:right-handed parallel beta-helix repeat-containing protein [Clostridia bacterium]
DDWYETRNPESDVYLITDEMAGRIDSWKTFDDVWMFGYWAYDWADASTPIGSFDREKKLLSPKFVSVFGTLKNDPPFYFFNVLEELDAPGEWYIDREEGMLYLYPTENFEDAKITLSLSKETLIKATGVEYLSFEGFTVEGTRGNAMEIEGDHVTVSGCLIKNVGCDALHMTGSFNLASGNEITRTGRGGITLDGGDRETLRAGENIAENNLIHDWSEVYLTYCPAVTLNGVGNVCRHNEIYNSPHEAIAFSGNDHDISYNHIYDVCTFSSDAGAIYSGRRWDWYGTKINYNYIHDIGRGSYTPNGIYLDDALSGITVIGNVLVNIKGDGMLLGGGRDLDVENNLLLNCHASIVYDDRAIEGAKSGTYWFAYDLDGMWKNLNDSPWKTKTWQKAYPAMARFSEEVDFDDPNYVPNPAYSKVLYNVGYKCSSQNLADEVVRFSDAVLYSGKKSENALKSVMEEIFADPAGKDFRIREGVEEIALDDPDFKPIPFGEIGRK